MKIYNNLFALLKAKIEAHPSGVNFKTIDWFNDQYNNTEKEEAETYPALYIEIQDDVQWENLIDVIQVADIWIKFHIVINTLDDIPLDINSAAQFIFEILHNQILVDENNAQVSTELIRKNTKLIKPFTQLKKAIIRFDSHVFDFTSVPEETNATFDPVITAGISEP